MRRHATRYACAALVLWGALASSTITPAGAQDAAESLDGAADFRTAPLVGPGTYRDTIVTGEIAWYSVLYTNDEDLHLGARLADVDADADDELELIRAFVGPNLEHLEVRPEDVGPGYSARWRGGETDTNQWFVVFELKTTGQVGVPHELEFTLSGFASRSQDECRAECTLDEELVELEDEIAALEAEVERCGDECADLATQDELVAERDDLQAAVDAEQAEIVDLCGGEECDALPATSTTPWWLVAILGAGALAAGGGFVRTLRQRGAAA